MKVNLREHALSIFFGLIFLAALIGQSIAGLPVHNEEQIAHGGEEATYLDFVTSNAFVVDVVDVAENWQSEFLAVGSMVAFSIYLRQRGSSESKPVGTPHFESAQEAE